MGGVDEQRERAGEHRTDRLRDEDRRRDREGERQAGAAALRCTMIVIVCHMHPLRRGGRAGWSPDLLLCLHISRYACVRGVNWGRRGERMGGAGPCAPQCPFLLRDARLTMPRTTEPTTNPSAIEHRVVMSQPSS